MTSPAKTPIISIICGLPGGESFLRDQNTPHVEEYPVFPANSTAFCVRDKTSDILVVTTYHSVQHARGMKIRVPDLPGYGATVRLVSWNPVSDVAVLRVVKEHGGHLEDLVEPLELWTVCDMSLWDSPVACYGFPSSISSIQIKVCTASGLTNRMHNMELVLSGTTNGGFSGGPVMRVNPVNGKVMTNHVVGMVTGGNGGEIRCCPADVICNAIESEGESMFISEYNPGTPLTADETYALTGIRQPGIRFIRIGSGTLLDMYGVRPGDIVFDMVLSPPGLDDEYHTVMDKGMVRYPWHRAPLDLMYSLSLIPTSYKISFGIITKSLSSYTKTGTVSRQFGPCRELAHPFMTFSEKISHRVVKDSHNQRSFVIRRLFYEEIIHACGFISDRIYSRQPMYAICHVFPESHAFLLDKFPNVTAINSINDEPVTALRIEDLPEEIKMIQTDRHFHIL